MKKMNGRFCRFVAVLLVLSGAVSLSACGVMQHAHKGVLQTLKTDAGGEIPCAGVFLCAECGETFEASVTYADVGIPVINIIGSTEGISKTQKVDVTVSYNGADSFTSRATLKWQGGSTLKNPKKNYSIQFLEGSGAKNAVRISAAWGAQSKYCLKANWDDFAGTRNIVAARLWSEIVHSRGAGDRLSMLPEGGAVNGFPVLLYENGDFYGLYTLNSPKDEWIFGMDGKSAQEGLLFGEEWSDSTQLRAPIADVNDPAASGWDVEYCATEDDPAVGVAWLFEGMNRLIGFLQTHEGAALKEGLGAYTDTDRVIDYMLYILFILGADNTGRNIIWATYDGVKYVPSAYDLDNTWPTELTKSHDELIGIWTDGTALRSNLLFDRVLDAYPEEIAARYAELRGSVLSAENVTRQFSAYLDGVPEIAAAADAERWPQEPRPAQDLLARLTEFYFARAAGLDAVFGYTEN